MPTPPSASRPIPRASTSSPGQCNTPAAPSSSASHSSIPEALEPISLTPKEAFSYLLKISLGTREEVYSSQQDRLLWTNKQLSLSDAAASSSQRRSARHPMMPLPIPQGSRHREDDRRDAHQTQRAAWAVAAHCDE